MPVTQRGRRRVLTGAGHYACSCVKRQSGQTISGEGIVVQRSKTRVKRPCTRFIGVDLGGSRGKTTALAELRLTPDGVEVGEVAKSAGHPWTDDSLMERLSGLGADTVLAIDAPLTRPACDRCELPVCPGMEACVDPAVIWLRTEGRSAVKKVAVEATVDGRPRVIGPIAQARLAPYAHRATDVALTYQRGLLPVSSLGAATGSIAARAGQLRRRLRTAGFELHDNLLEVSPSATVAALCGPRAARGYKRDADPWRTRAMILEKLSDLTFAARSRMAREDALGNDHCFDAVLSAYTAYLWARDGWEPPEGVFVDDGWIFAPP
jgi:hypothetical protein